MITVGVSDVLQRVPPDIQQNIVSVGICCKPSLVTDTLIIEDMEECESMESYADICWSCSVC